jgi:hypothetical protein
MQNSLYKYTYISFHGARERKRERESNTLERPLEGLLSRKDCELFLALLWTIYDEYMSSSNRPFPRLQLIQLIPRPGYSISFVYTVCFYYASLLRVVRIR